MANIECQLLRHEDQLLALETEWRALFEAAGQPSPFLDFDWVLMTWRRLVQSGGIPRAAIVRADGRLVLALPLQRRRWYRLIHYYSGPRSAMPSYDDALLAPSGDAEPWLTATVEAVRSPLGAGLIFDNVPQESRLNAVLSKHEVGQPVPYAVVRLTGDHGAYIARFPVATRKADRRQERYLLPGGAVPLRVGTAETLNADLDWLFASKRAWQPSTGAVREWLTDPQYERDLRALLARWGASDGARLFFIDGPDGRPAAGAMLLIAGRRAIYYLVTYDPRFARASPGRMLSLKIIERLDAEGFQCLDLMGSNSEWKQRLKNCTCNKRTYALGGPWWYRLIRRLARRG